MFLSRPVLFPVFVPSCFVSMFLSLSVLLPWKPRVQFRECSHWFWLVCGELWLAELNNGLTWYKAHVH